MFFYRSKSHYPEFNLAAEEYFLKNFKEEFWIVYQNMPSIIVGKHQNTNAEINHSFVKKNRLPVVRRISGGGAVYHDLGNLNFTFITQRKQNEGVNYENFAQVLIAIMNRFGIKAELKEKSSIFYDKYKISGMAAHVWKERILHHGTLLFNTDLNALGNALDSNFLKYSSKGVSSKRSKVGNVNSWLEDTDIDEFMNFFIQKSVHKNTPEYLLADDDVTHINTLVRQKFSTKEWNFAYSPHYIFENTFEADGNKVTVSFSVKKGRIEDFHLNGLGAIGNELVVLLPGVLHCWDDVKEKVLYSGIHDQLGFDLNRFTGFFI